jgi:hypothetical protein
VCTPLTSESDGIIGAILVMELTPVANDVAAGAFVLGES